MRELPKAESKCLHLTVFADFAAVLGESLFVLRAIEICN